MQASDFMTVSETAEWLQVHKVSVYRGVREGELPYIKLGRQIRIPRDAFLEYVQRKAVDSVEG